MSKNPDLNLVHIIESITAIQDFAKTRDDLDNPMAYFACLRCLQTMSESCQRLPHSIKNLHTDIQWRNISGFRNVLVHDYLDEINPEIVWNAIHNELPALKMVAITELKKLGQDYGS